MKTKIESIWQELENDDSLHLGILYKRYSANVLPNVYVALRTPEKLRCIAAHISKVNQPDISVWNKFKDIKVEVLSDENDSSKSFLLILLLNQKHLDVFSVLSEDLIINISKIGNENQVIKELLNRIIKWHTLFEKFEQPGLTSESQRGLYGELYFLRKFLHYNSKNIYCLKSWQVPSNTVQDFHHRNWAVEVKTTYGNNHQKIHINSERQLDDSIVPDIFLYHLSLDIRSDYGETLNNIVEGIENYLNDDEVSYNLFKLKLFEVGYFDINKTFYNEAAYNIRQETIFKVKDDFPRISENQIHSGVWDVKYSILISDCASYITNESDLLNFIKSE